ncbi:radical SAM family heme chaperone HemW [Lachnoclostridium sp. Marseille-P6806]|uniref:radical SAM family heme chaperone HemW n=1 Tax=Lachnoclostridium sp. Marseille-P6806 TaxID=2364793 RepID=UPI0010319874|nr:radical SAM family heme chaperone HemW [Lachnoclostridium sp. Marseille-P6806]
MTDRELERLEERSRGGFCSLYLHIPFCVRKCAYCDFLSGPADAVQREHYVRSLIREIRETECEQPVDSVFFGGGTPSVLAAEQMSRIMAAVREHFSLEETAEITAECNPGTARQEDFSVWREAGINRISLGIQSLDDGELRLLGRIHTAEEARESFRAARAAGFGNISLDLMSALPGQTPDRWEETLCGAAELEPDHISAYSLIIEEGTVFGSLYACPAPGGDSFPSLPDEETEREMYRRTREVLREYGYERYEISSYARPGRVCAHNIGYWTGHPYLGLGTGAASLAVGPGPGASRLRYANTCDMNRYLGRKRLSEIREDLQELTDRERMEEFMFLGLRLALGVSETEFFARFGRPLPEIYGDVLARHEALGLVRRERGRIFLTEYGTDVSNSVMADYLLDPESAASGREE